MDDLSASLAERGVKYVFVSSRLVLFPSLFSNLPFFSLLVADLYLFLLLLPRSHSLKKPEYYQ